MTFVLFEKHHHFSPPPSPGNHHSTLCSCEFHFFRFHICDIISIVFAFICFVPLSIIPSRSIHVLQVAGFPCFRDWKIFHHVYIYMYVYVCIHIYVYIHIHIYVYTHTHQFLFIHSFTDGRLGCFYILAIVNDAAVNIGVQISLWDSYFISLGNTPTSRIAGSYGKSSWFNFWCHFPLSV